VTGGGISPSRRWLLVLAGALVGLLAAWFLLRGRPAEVAKAPEAEDEPAAPATTTPPFPPRRTVRAPTQPAAPEEVVVTSDGLPIMPAHPNDPRPDGPVHPHPITPQHQRIFAENRLIGDLNGAMDVKDAPAMRRFLEQYRREYPEDDNMLQDGYAVIADCFEHPGAQARAAAERWVQTHNGSTLKRFVNRHCLEPQP
jgi:hypothetical protein